MIDYLTSGKRLYLLCTGTGLAPFMSNRDARAVRAHRRNHRSDRQPPPVQRPGRAAAEPTVDRVTICGSPAMLPDLRAMLDVRGFKEVNTSIPGAFVIERAFVER